MGLPHFCFPFRDRSIVGLEAVKLRLGKQLEKSCGVIPVIGAYFQDNRIAPADHGWQTIQFEFDPLSLSAGGGRFRAPFLQSKPSS
jgi:hypothetical protein